MEGRDVGVRGEREWLVRCNWSGEGDAEIIQGRGGGYAGMRAFVGHQLRGGGGGGVFFKSKSSGGGGSTRETAVHTELD
jgi:hypothetical protein